MEFRDLGRQYAALKEQMDAAIGQVIEKTAFISGSQVGELERRLAEYAGRKHCIACGNGTDALELMLKVYGIGSGDAVFVPDFTFFASAESICTAGAVPIFVDVEEDTFNMDARKLERAAERVKREGRLVPRAVMPVDLFGLPADYPAISAVAKKYGLLVLEDAAQGFGGALNGRRTCAFGDASSTSFFPAKPLGCYGDGGAVFTDDDEKAMLLRSLTVHGKGGHKYDNIRLGRNSRLDTIQAAVLLVKLDALRDYELKSVNDAAAKYTELLQGTVKVPTVPAGMVSSWAQYTILLQNEAERDWLAAHMKQQGIPVNIYYPKRMRDQEALKGYLPMQVDDCPVSLDLTGRVLSLPIHPYLTDAEIETVAAEVVGAVRR